MNVCLYCLGGQSVREVALNAINTHGDKAEWQRSRP